MNELSSNEWRELKTRADQHSLQCDILGDLPLELAAHISEHMVIADMIRLRRVIRPDSVYRPNGFKLTIHRSHGDGSRF